MRKIIFLLVYLCTTTLSIAQTKAWTLEECMQYAIQQSTVKNKLEAQNKIYDQNYNEAIAQLFPQLEAETQMGFNFGRGLDAETNIYTDVNSFNNTYSLSAQLVLFDGLTNVTRVKLHKVNKLLGKQQLQYTKDLVAFETMEIFFNALYYHEMTLLAQEQWEESIQTLSRVKRMEELGMTSYPDVAELAAKTAADQYILTRQKNLYLMEVIRLKEKMGFPMDEELEIAGSDTIAPILPIEESPLSIYQSAVFYLPHAQAAETALRAQQLTYRATKGTLSPTLTANGGLSTGFARFMDGTEYIPFAEQFKNKRGYYVGVTLSIPLFDGLARLSNVKRSKQQVVIARNEKEEKLRTLYSEIEQAVADANGQAEEYHQAERQEEAMKLAHQLNLRKYEEGLIHAIELHTSSNRLMQAKTERINARLKYALKYRLVNYYKGQPFVNE